MPLHTGDLQNLIAYNRAQAAVSPSLNPTFEGSSPGTVLELRAAPLRVHLGKLTAEGRLTGELEGLEGLREQEEEREELGISKGGKGGTTPELVEQRKKDVTCYDVGGDRAMVTASEIARVPAVAKVTSYCCCCCCRATVKRKGALLPTVLLPAPPSSKAKGVRGQGNLGNMATGLQCPPGQVYPGKAKTLNK
jgi:hypothetical protein